MDSDVLRLVASKLPVSDVANISLVVRDQNIIRDRKKEEYETAFDRKMRSLWYGRFVMLYKMYTTTNFWDFDFPNMWACHARMRDHFRYLFREWTTDTCGSKLHLSTRILDRVLSITVDLHAPYHSVGSGDTIRFEFDVIHSNFPLDIDAYAPKGEFTCVLEAMYRALALKTKQTGVMTNAGVQWTKIVTMDELMKEFERVLGPSWKRDDDDCFYKHHQGVCAKTRYAPLGGDIHFSYKNQTSIINIGYYSYMTYRGAYPSTQHRPGGTLYKRLLDVLTPFTEYASIHPVSMSKNYSIKIRIHDKEHEFCSWAELSEITKISIPKLSSMAISSANGVFIDFGKHTYKRKPIHFVVPDDHVSYKFT